MTMGTMFLGEIEQEAATTRRVLERIPEGKFGWKPHAKSMSLGVLASHVATTPGGIARMLLVDSVDMDGFHPPVEPESLAALLRTFDDDLAEAKKILADVSDEQMSGNWSVLKDGKPVMTMPKSALMRVIAMNHLYHHRGQLSVYLRLLDIPVPSIYGPSADDNPFAR